MPRRTHLPRVFLIIALALPCACRAQSAVGLDLEAPFAMAWTVQLSNVPTGRTASNGDELFSSKLVTLRATARDLLFGMLDAGQISPPLSGWKVVARSNDRDVMNGNYTLFAVKRGQTDVEIKDGAGSPVMVISNPVSGPFASSGRAREGTLLSAVGVSQLYFSGTLFVSPISFFYTGLANQPFTLSSRTIDQTTSTPSLPGTVKMSIQGLGSFDAAGTFIPVSTRGSMTFSPHRITSTYLIP